MRKSTDVTAEKYVKDQAQWRAARGATPPPDLEITINRTGAEIAHLTTKRLPAGDPNKVWDLEKITDAFITPLKTFLAHVPPGRLDASVTEFITRLPIPGAPAPAASKGGPVTTSVPTGMIVHGTDVSTP